MTPADAARPMVTPSAASMKPCPTNMRVTDLRPGAERDADADLA